MDSSPWNSVRVVGGQLTVEFGKGGGWTADHGIR